MGGSLLKLPWLQAARQKQYTSFHNLARTSDEALVARAIVALKSSLAVYLKRAKSPQADTHAPLDRPILRWDTSPVSPYVTTPLQQYVVFLVVDYDGSIRVQSVTEFDSCECGDGPLLHAGAGSFPVTASAPSLVTSLYMRREASSTYHLCIKDCRISGEPDEIALSHILSSGRVSGCRRYLWAPSRAPRGDTDNETVASLPAGADALSRPLVTTAARLRARCLLLLSGSLFLQRPPPVLPRTRPQPVSSWDRAVTDPTKHDRYVAPSRITLPHHIVSGVRYGQPRHLSGGISCDITPANRIHLFSELETVENHRFTANPSNRNLWKWFHREPVEIDFSAKKFSLSPRLGIPKPARWVGPSAPPLQAITGRKWMARFANHKSSITYTPYIIDIGSERLNGKKASSLHLHHTLPHWSPFSSIACGNRAARCRWSAGFLGDLPFPPPLHSGAVPRTHLVSPAPALETAMLRADLGNLSTPLLASSSLTLAYCSRLVALPMALQTTTLSFIGMGYSRYKPHAGSDSVNAVEVSVANREGDVRAGGCRCWQIAGRLAFHTQLRRTNTLWTVVARGRVLGPGGSLMFLEGAPAGSPAVKDDGPFIYAEGGGDAPIVLGRRRNPGQLMSSQRYVVCNKSPHHPTVSLAGVVGAESNQSQLHLQQARLPPQPVAFRGEPGETEYTAAKLPLHTCCDVNCNTNAVSQLTERVFSRSLLTSQRVRSAVPAGCRERESESERRCTLGANFRTLSGSHVVLKSIGGSRKRLGTAQGKTQLTLHHTPLVTGLTWPYTFCDWLGELCERCLVGYCVLRKGSLLAGVPHGWRAGVDERPLPHVAAQ
ncbi:hypothetical protein PR048_002232 [Dryococelus australis]|uniref:Uncharacterized protein n=1 Tax=Dryococelus australis TaxID=614101 RepID=A0ABQ9IKP4_9NEOP|nr:hypothetical protein PR048_002232 [Dryococelus australis]